MAKITAMQPRKEPKRRPGRHKKYGSAKALAERVEEYFAKLPRKGSGEYKVAPNKAGLCVFLEISKSTWDTYAKDDKMKGVVEWAELMCRDYWAGTVLPKNPTAAKFALQWGFGRGKAPWTYAGEGEAGRTEDQGKDATGVIELQGVVDDMEEETGDG